MLHMTTHALQIDLECTECSYNLRGLKPSGRCPECGTRIADTFRAIREKQRRSEEFKQLLEAELQECRLPAILLACSLALIGIRFVLGDIEPDVVTSCIWLFGSLAPGAFIGTIITARLGFIGFISLISLLVNVAASVAIGAAIFLMLPHYMHVYGSQASVVVPALITIGLLAWRFDLDLLDFRNFAGIVIVATAVCSLAGYLLGIF